MKRLDTRAAFIAVLLTLLLAGCASQGTGPVSYEETLVGVTFELTAAANTLADARDAGIVPQDSDTYQDIKAVLLDAQTYVELAWTYYLDGNLTESDAARKAALHSYSTVRGALVRYRETLED